MSAPRHAVERPVPGHPEDPTSIPRDDDGAPVAAPAAGATGVGATGAAATAGTPAGPTPAAADDTPVRTETRSRTDIARDLRDRLLREGPTDRLWGWVGPIVVAVLAAVLRLVNLNHPTRLMFDETYYVKQAYSLMTLGYEGDWPGEDVNDRFREGDFSDLSTEADYVVHPHVGKWLIALGLRVAGADNGAGWRLSAAIFGALSVLMIARIARRLFGSTLLGTAAGFLLAIDGMHLTESRIGLLDVFVMFFVVAGFGAVLRDRERTRRILADRVAADLAGRGDGKFSDPWGPSTGIRWWLVVAGVLLGLACGVKWSGIYALAVFGILVLVWDICARRAVGVRLWFGGGVFRGGFPAFFSLVPVAALTYLAGWWSWFASPGAYLRQWAADEVAAKGEVVRSYLPDALNSWWEYHLRMWDFHNGLDSEHSYEAHPAGWIIQWRPTSLFWEGETPAGETCAAERCVQAISSVGNPVIWWLGALALLVVLWAAVRRRDWRAWAILAGYAATYFPWFAYVHRTIFTFYAIALVPFVVLALVFALAWATGMLPPLHGPGPAAHRRWRKGAGSADDDAARAPVAPGDGGSGDAGATSAESDGAGPGGDAAVPAEALVPADGSVPVPPAGATPATVDVPATRLDRARRWLTEVAGTAVLTKRGLVVLAVVVVLAAAASIFFWPVWTGQTIPYDSWRTRMWLPSWV
ncbi:dolichyl-phosphate-mannose--protein mannosyltransferase [Georgenia wangjunii]|uniref:dolichyl-phosphate-mannose--protein mannosyltransferase n=1 Tax=Georgenia wangjunii TaxID=3117730 RepID=UPI002F2666B2